MFICSPLLFHHPPSPPATGCKVLLLRPDSSSPCIFLHPHHVQLPHLLLIFHMLHLFIQICNWNSGRAHLLQRPCGSHLLLNDGKIRIGRDVGLIHPHLHFQDIALLSLDATPMCIQPLPWRVWWSSTPVPSTTSATLPSLPRGSVLLKLSSSVNCCVVLQRYEVLGVWKQKPPQHLRLALQLSHFSLVIKFSAAAPGHSRLPLVFGCSTLPGWCAAAEINFPEGLCIVFILVELFCALSASLRKGVFFTRRCMMRSTYCWSFQVVFNIFLGVLDDGHSSFPSSTPFINTAAFFWKYIQLIMVPIWKKYIFNNTSLVDCCIWHNSNPTEHVFWQEVKFLNPAKCNTDQTAILSMHAWFCSRFCQLF